MQYCLIFHKVNLSEISEFKRTATGQGIDTGTGNGNKEDGIGNMDEYGNKKRIRGQRTALGKGYRTIKRTMATV